MTELRDNNQENQENTWVIVYLLRNKNEEAEMSSCSTGYRRNEGNFLIRKSKQNLIKYVL